MTQCHRFLLHLALPGLLLLGTCSAVLPSTHVREDTEQPVLPFRRYLVHDSLSREITFYLIDHADDSAALPLILFVQGSGAQSSFMRIGNHIGGGIQTLLHSLATGRARTLIVEKPGVAFLDDPDHPGSAVGASEEYLWEFTAERWTEANLAALRAALNLPGVDPSRTLAIGHSEGGLIAGMVAAREPKVTHVASLAGGGPTQLFDLLEIYARMQGDDDTPEAIAARREHVLAKWREIEQDPDATDELWLGHPFRRWSSFLRHSLVEELTRTEAKILLAQGTADDATSIHAHDLLIAKLALHGRPFTEIRLHGAGHGFEKVLDPADGAQEDPQTGLMEVLERAVNWFLSD